MLKSAEIQVVNNGTSISVTGNPNAHPGNGDFDAFYLNEAIDRGFRLLPIFRLMRIVNQDISPEWRFFQHYGTQDGLHEKFAEVVQCIEGNGGGFSFVRNLLDIPEERYRPWTEYLKQYIGSEKKFDKAISEWSDGDSVATHIASRIDYFCTNDQATVAGQKSVFGKKIRKVLEDKYGLKIITPKELVEIANHPMD